MGGRHFGGCKLGGQHFGGYTNSIEILYYCGGIGPPDPLLKAYSSVARQLGGGQLGGRHLGGRQFGGATIGGSRHFGGRLLGGPTFFSTQPQS